MSRRGVAAGAVLAAWAVGLGLLVRREYFRPRLDTLAEAAARVTPGAMFYGVLQGDRAIGFASSTIDTLARSITMRDYLVANLPVGGAVHRATARTDVTLSRSLRVREFGFSLESDAPALRASGHVEGDTLLIVAIATGTQRPDTQRVRLTGPVLLPTLVPLAISLGERPKVGKRYELPLFDPIAMTARTVGFTVRAESLFVLADSAMYDSTARRWRPAERDTIRAWQVASDATAGSGVGVASLTGSFDGWIDEQGRVVETRQLGLDLKRLPYEVAWEGWQRAQGGGAVVADRDILETTAIAANKRLAATIPSLRVRLAGADLRGFELDGGRQRFRDGVLTIAREPDAALRAGYSLPAGARERFPALVRAEPLLQVGQPEIARVARRVAGATERDPRVAVERLTRWVHDSLSQRITFGIPDALQVLHSRTGDCNEHTQLFVALARTLGIPTRIATGLAYIDGKFYYHAWPEVYLGDWVAVDPTFGQVPADASHLRFVIGNLGRQAELLRLMGSLRIDVLNSARGA